MIPLNNKAIARFWKYVDRRGENDCWAWTGASTRTGYGYFGIEYKMYIASRVSWEIHNGPIQDGLFVLHRCDNPGCVNPAHLFVGSLSDNTRDSVSKGRFGHQRAYGEKAGAAKLTNDQVRAIRAEYIPHKVTARSLSEKYGVARDTIKSILCGKTWGKVK